MAFIKRLKVGAQVDITTTDQFANVANHAGAFSDVFDNSAGLWTHGYLEFVDLLPSLSPNTQFKLLLYTALDGTNYNAHGGIADVDANMEVGRIHGGDSASPFRIAVPVRWLSAAKCKVYFVNESGNTTGLTVECYFYPCTTEIVSA